MDVELEVPATLSNLGPGFDCFGLSLDLTNHVRARPAERRSLVFSGRFAQGLSGGPESLLWRALDRCCERFRLERPSLAVEVEVRVPPGRGLGSSATAVAAGLALAVAGGGKAPEADRLCALGTELEGHPDNIVPALCGGLCLCLEGGRHLRFEPPAELEVLALSPASEVSTAEARLALPELVPLRDAVFNLGRAAALAAALVSGRLEVIRGLDLVRDRLHQNVRARHIPGFDAAVEAGMGAGALGVCISGSGPTVLTLCAAGDGNAGNAARAVQEVLARHGLPTELRSLHPSGRGVLEQI
jgi:homoserine kinase